jgi:2-hydroxychromene-2-carboxylate isomerase
VALRPRRPGGVLPAKGRLQVLVLHFDYVSAASAVAVLRVQRVADRGGDVVFSGVDVLGVDTALPVTLDQLAELERWAPRAAALGLELRRPTRRPPTLSAHLVGELAVSRGLGAAWRLAVLEAYWTRGLAIGETGVLLELAAGVGLEPTRVRARLEDPRQRVDLRRAMTAQRGRGIGDVPVLETGGTFVPADLTDEDLEVLAGL